MSIDLRRKDEGLARSFLAPGMPKPSHEAEAGPLSRMAGIPGYRQEAVKDACIALIGAGGLGSWIGTGVVRSGLCKHLIILDKDRFDLSNTNRQLLYTADIGKYKALTLARNLVPHAVRQTYITAIALPFEEVLRSRMQSLLRGVNLAVFGVDNDHCRLDGALWARHLHIPAVFTALSLDGTRCESFLQERNPQDACLHCALPELHPALAAPCAFASITSCFLASAYTLYFCERALCGWGEGAAPFNWRMADLRGLTPERTGRVKQRPSCPTCGPLK